MVAPQSAVSIFTIIAMMSAMGACLHSIPVCYLKTSKLEPPSLLISHLARVTVGSRRALLGSRWWSHQLTLTQTGDPCCRWSCLLVWPCTASERYVTVYSLGEVRYRVQPWRGMLLCTVSERYVTVYGFGEEARYYIACHSVSAILFTNQLNDLCLSYWDFPVNR